MATGGLITQQRRGELVNLDETLRSCQREIAIARQEGNKLVEAFATAAAMQQLRTCMSDKLLQSLMPLMNSPLGFITDRDGKTVNRKTGQPLPRYTAEQLRDPLIEGMLKGFRPVGKEIGIIGGNFYALLDGMERVVREFPGLTDLKLRPGVPNTQQGGALVPYYASWKLNGVADELVCAAATATTHDTRIVVRVNDGMGSDAILGKAKRKMLARIYEQISGAAIKLAEIDNSDTIDGEVVGASEVVDEPVATATDAQDDAPEMTVDFEELYTHYQQRLAQCRTIGEVNNVYRELFSPESKLMWPQEMIQDAIKAKSFVKQSLAQKA